MLWSELIRYMSLASQIAVAVGLAGAITEILKLVGSWF